MKTITFFLVFFPAILCSSCEKEDLTDSIDITQFSWMINSITITDIKHKVKKDNYHNSEAYILVFESDSIFKLNTSVNLAKGKFQIYSKGNINVFYYHEITEVGGQTEIDNKLLKYVPSVSSYQVFNNILLLKGKNCEIELKKK